MKVHLICNAHIDPAWLWDLEDGRAATLATFRTAARLAEQYDFIFCHNEALLYQWIQEDDPALFSRIKTLVAAGRWHIAGGWYLQPDCNLPSGETLLRIIERGRVFFYKHFGVLPTTAMNLDPFGHSRGLVQLLKKSGFDSYLICRPHVEPGEPENNFTWVGPDGSEVCVTRVPTHYNSRHGYVVNKIQAVMDASDQATVIVLWGVGNHGGGPSAADLETIARMAEDQQTQHQIVHSTPERYMAETCPREYRRDTSLNPCMPGCYSAMARVKRLFRLLENELWEAEAICAHADALGLHAYPDTMLSDAADDLMLATFHDILPGTGVEKVEAAAYRLIEHGRELCARARSGAFHVLYDSFAPAENGCYPVFVYNPHAFAVQCEVQVDFVLAEQNYSGSITGFKLNHRGESIPVQIIKEEANLRLDWVKRAVFPVRLPSAGMYRFLLEPYESAPPAQPSVEGGTYRFSNDHMSAEIDLSTGLMTRYAVDGVEMIDRPAFALKVYRDNDDPWAMSTSQYWKIGELCGSFAIMDPHASAEFSGNFDAELPAVRLIEEGPVLTRLEALFSYGSSAARIVYTLYRARPYFDVEVLVQNREINTVIRLAVPVSFDGDCRSEGPYCDDTVPGSGQERPMQRWVSLTGEKAALAVANNAAYSVRYEHREIEIALLRSASYAAHPAVHVANTPPLRYIPHLDQGAVQSGFRILGGAPDAIEGETGGLAAVFNNAPRTLCAFSDGEGDRSDGLLHCEGPACLNVTSVRKKDDRVQIRMVNSSGLPCEGVLSSPLAEEKLSLTFGPYEVKTALLGSDGFYQCARLNITGVDR